MALPKEWRKLDTISLIGLLDKKRREAEEEDDDESWHDVYEIQDHLQERLTNVDFVNDKVEQLILAVKELQRIVREFSHHKHGADGLPAISKPLQEPSISAEI